MYKHTVGEIERREFTSMLKGSGYSIFRGCTGHELIKDNHKWYEKKSNTKQDVVRHLTLKQ